MGTKIYCIREEGPVFKKMMAEKGYELVVGKGIELDKLADVDVILPIMLPIGAKELDHAPKCKLICKVGVGVDNIDLEECARRGIPVCNTPLSNYVAVAEHAIALMFAVGHRIYERELVIKDTDTPDFSFTRIRPNFECMDKVFGIIGFGNNGRYAAKLAHGLGMKVMVYSEHARKEDVPDYVMLANSVEELLAHADVLSLHIAATPDQKNYMDAEKFAMMKDGAIFINVSRGFVVDEDALIAVLKSGKLFGAGLDVVNDESHVKPNELFYMPNVIITQHCAAGTPEASAKAQLMQAENIISFIENGVVPEGRLKNNPVKK